MNEGAVGKEDGHRSGSTCHANDCQWKERVKGVSYRSAYFQYRSKRRYFVVCQRCDAI